MENKTCKHHNDTPADRIIKGYVMPVIGMAIMILAVWLWWIDEEVEDLRVFTVFVIGFAIVYMRNSLPTYIKKLINKKLK